MRTLRRTCYLGAAGLVALWLALVLLVVHIDQSQARTPGSISFDATELVFATPSEGDIMSVPINAANVNDVDGYDLWISFDPNVVRLVGLWDNYFLSGYDCSDPNASCTIGVNDPVVCITPTITADSGHIACQVFSLKAMFETGADPTLGAHFPVTRVSVNATPVPIAYAGFQQVAPGTSHLNLAAGPSQSSGLTGVDRTPISVSLGSASLTVALPPSVGGIAEEPSAAVLRANDASQRMAYVGVTVLLLSPALVLLAWRRRKGAHHA